uniref:Uncharacterized protein n=1 Tax=Zea mays TaxID=4577 RepID=B6U168_MAIZE|nr:hypothetical protein [Zea mays]ACG47347.1 hypothetical protein [Zea mays]
MATAAAGLAPAKEVVEKKVELLKEIRAHEVAIAELDNLNPSRASPSPPERPPPPESSIYPRDRSRHERPDLRIMYLRN